MASGAAAVEMILRCVLDGSLVMQEIEVERRPYHRNCSCALHNLKGTVVCSSACSRARNLSFSKKKTRNDCSLSMENSKSSSQSSILGDSLFRNPESKTSMGFCFKDDENMSEV